MNHNVSYSAQDYLTQIHQASGIGFWRTLYLSLFMAPPLNAFKSIVELGSGAPDFLKCSPYKRRVAVDIGDKHRGFFQEAGIDLQVLDLEKDDFGGLGAFDIAVCSDVFEHLFWPAVTLKKIPGILTERGVLVSHVPNEYNFIPTLKIMMGLKDGLYFHHDQTEWTDPHVRRFTDRGYKNFLQQEFQYNVKITHLKYRPAARIISSLRLPVPFCLEGGPTYISTNNQDTYRKIVEMVEAFPGK